MTPRTQYNFGRTWSVEEANKGADPLVQKSKLGFRKVKETRGGFKTSKWIKSAFANYENLRNPRAPETSKLV